MAFRDRNETNKKAQNKRKGANGNRRKPLTPIKRFNLENLASELDNNELKNTSNNNNKNKNKIRKKSFENVNFINHSPRIDFIEHLAKHKTVEDDCVMSH